MRRLIKQTTVLLSVLLVVGMIPDQVAPALDGFRNPGEDSGPFLWLDNLEQARVLARTQEKPLLIVFRCEP